MKSPENIRLPAFCRIRVICRYIGVFPAQEDFTFFSINTVIIPTLEKELP